MQIAAFKVINRSLPDKYLPTYGTYQLIDLLMSQSVEVSRESKLVNSGPQGVGDSSINQPSPEADGQVGHACSASLAPTIVPLVAKLLTLIPEGQQSSTDVCSIEEP